MEESTESVKQLIWVAIYIRVSTNRQINTYSPGEQKRILTEFAEKKGWKIYDYYADLGESGTDAEREDLDRLLSDARKGVLSRVLIFEQERLSRLDQVEWAYLANELAKLNVRLTTPTSEYNLDNEDDRFLADLFNLLANRELKKTRKRTSMGRRAAHRAGVFFGRTTPFGVGIDRETNTWYTIPEEVQIVNSIFNLFKPDYGLWAVSRRLNELGYRTRAGVKWDQAKVKRVIINPVCIGEFSQTVCGESLKHKIKWAQGHGPYITVERFKKAQETLRERGEILALWEPKYLLIGLLVCDECNRRFQSHGSVHNLANKKGKVYYSYLHRNALRTCTARHNMNTTHERVISILKNIAGNPQAIAEMLKETSKPANIENLNSQINQCHKERSQLLLKKSKLLDLYMEGTWSKEELDTKKQELDKKLHAFDTRDEELQNQLIAASQTQVDIEAVSNALEILIDFDKELSEKEQMQLIRTVVSQIRIKRNGDLTLFLNVNIDKEHLSKVDRTF